MSKDFEAWLGGGYFFGGMAFLVWFLLTETPASRLILSLSTRPFGRFFILPLGFMAWVLWPIALAAIGFWTLLLKDRGRADA